MSSAYETSSVQATSNYGPYSKLVNVYGLKILGLNNVGGMPAVSNQFSRKLLKRSNFFSTQMLPESTKSLEKKP